MNKKAKAVNALTQHDIMKGKVGPNISHRRPVMNEPNIMAILENIVISPIAVPLSLFGIRSETQAFVTPSVEAAKIPYNIKNPQIKLKLVVTAKPK